jgi:hypothetical protein
VSWWPYWLFLSRRAESASSFGPNVAWYCAYAPVSWRRVARKPVSLSMCSPCQSTPSVSSWSAARLMSFCHEAWLRRD